MNLAILPNLLTVGRMLAVPPLVILLLTGHYGWALAVAIVAGLSDLLDGWLARRYGWTSRFGSLADPAADKIMMVSSYLTLAWLEYLPWWLFGLVILRDLVIVIGGWIYHLKFERLEAQPTQLSRFNTFCQVFLMWYVLVYLAGFPLPPEGQTGLELLVAVLAGVTLVHYTWLWSMKAVAVSRERRAGPDA
ncbi:MAG: CDP-alcohol phosphatidyltransferase family protein [Wenzhouxiangellaceae bacterium]|nr:MAG: CDP-alcohol phosphatidyltransferase family protein [Wenzhouxiangellaceae bacterium]